MILNNKGLTIVESLIAVMLTGFAIVLALTMEPLGWQSAGKADSMARATEIMQRELELVEMNIMTSNFTSLSELNKTNVAETVSNETFTINVNVSTITANATWLARVRVTWPQSTKGVRSSILVTTQSTFK